MAGGGIQGGITHGTTDELGMLADEDPHYVTDIHATILTQLGVDLHTMEVPGRKWLVLGGMMELGAAEDHEHASLGQDLVCGDWTQLITVGTLGEKIAHGAMRAGWSPDATLCCSNNAEAAQALRDLAK